MPVIRRRDEDRVDLLDFEQPAHVSTGCRLASLLSRVFGSTADPFAVDVADVRDANVLLGDQGADVA
jgi:hypothetical protein